MIKIFYFVIILGFVFAINSCENYARESTLSNPPSNITELHNSFNKKELTPKVISNDDSSIVIIATGHLYPLLGYPLAYNSFVESIAAQNPDYVFILGDVVYNNTQKEWDLFFSYFSDVKDKLYFSPGNHDLNFHYERYFGKRDHQFEAEQRYIDNVGYRYMVLKDNIADYVFINLNDSLDRVLDYLNRIDNKLDKNKPLLLFSSQAIWHNKHQDPNDSKTWPNKPFKREEFIPHIEDFDYLIHGDWGGKFYRDSWPKKMGYFQVMGVGNRTVGDSLYISRIEIFHDTIISYGIPVSLPDESGWYGE